MTDLLGPRCGCADCESAVSPGAYLASLLDYALKHVRNNGTKVDLAFLEARFHQPFSDLPIDCEAMEKKVRQVRIAVEVLRAYLRARPLSEPAGKAALSSAEADYRLAAYMRLLTLLGTTYEELRRARSATAEDRLPLAERLGIDLTETPPAGPRQDELDRLLLDPSLPDTDERALTEQTLERVFGLADTVRDSLSEGAKLGDDQDQIQRWNINGAYWNRNTDAEGLVHLRLLRVAADAYALEVYSDEARTRLAASGEGKTASGAFRIAPANGSGLFGVVEIDYQADHAGISLSLLPSILCWRLRHLRTLWEREDWPTDPPAADARAILPPLIDPQVISVGDLAGPHAGDVAFDLWLARSNWVDGQRSALKASRESAANPLAGIETIMGQALSMPGRLVTVASLDDLKQAQLRGERIEQRLKALGLAPGAFAFLMPILELARRGEPIVEPEWDLVYDTLLRARTQLEFASWRAAERTLKLTLSPSYFRAGDSTGAPVQATSLSGPLWLSTREARRTWLDVLEARIAQETAVVSGLADAVSSVEETTLPLLRDGLIMAADSEGNLLPDRAEWLTQRLLLDLRMSGQQVTTPVAQAIETLQELFFSLRTGQLEQDTLLASAPLESIWAVPQGVGRIHVFGRAKDDALWHRIWDGRWRSWRCLGPLPGGGTSYRPSNPAVVAQAGGRLDLVVIGSDRSLWHRTYNERWLDWSRVDGDQELVGHPAAVLRAANQMDVFALRIGDLEVMQRRFDGTNWSPWQATGVTSSRSPAAVSREAGRLDLVLGRRAPDLFKPLHRWWDGAAWQDEPLDNALFGDPAIAAWDANRLDVFQNFNGHLWQKTWNGAWQPWTDLDALPTGAPAGPPLQAPPSVYSSAPGTLQVFALRSGSTVEDSVWRRRFEAGAWSDWEGLPSDHLELDAYDFDQEWAWIGSYATWRAAVFVRLYPENLLLPSLIKHQTPVFRTLVAESRPTKRLNPKRACELAQEYSTYLRDVTSLEIGATCQVQTEIDLNDPCKTPAPVRKNLLYMFGRTAWGKVYWSAIDPGDRSGYAQSFWEEVPLGPKDGSAPVPKVLRIIGALPWLDRDAGQHFIYLFLDTDEPGGRKLRLWRFNLDSYGKNGAWAAGALLDLPPHPTTGAPVTPGWLTILPVQSDMVTEPPRLAVHEHLTTFNAYIRPLNPTGDGWEGSAGDWMKYLVKTRYRQGDMILEDSIQVLEAALRVNKVSWLVYQFKDYYGNRERRAFATVAGQGGAYLCACPSTFRGALCGSGLGSTIFVFYDENGQSVYREFRKNPAPGTLSPGVGTAFIPTPNLRTLAPHSGSFAPTFFVTPNKGHHSYAYRCRALEGELIGSSKFDVVPVLGPTTNIPVGETMAALQARRGSIKGVYQENKGASASILTYLAEAYRLVPLQLALNMQSSREYVAALDWFMTVYDYRAAQAERSIDYGLVIDAGLPETAIYQHPEDWLLDPLNPHAVALTRRYTYTRFTITSIIRCLNEFADAEFTFDTGESLTRARLLYTTALELCGVPELRQRLGVCEALIGALKIQPGAMTPPAIAAALGEIAEELTLGGVASAPNGLMTLEKMKELVQSGKPWGTVLPELIGLKTLALKTAPVSATTATSIGQRPVTAAEVYSGLLADPAMERLARLAGEVAIARASLTTSEP